ncbi:MAG: addiction module toxin, HicA family [Candidatus Kapabacteria bacterium]|nr:addiction module toxin, HicA family [Candidatus Kapabacteria bacterium]
MKRRDLIAHLLHHGCLLLREGARHSIWLNPANDRISAVPRHSEINDFLAARIFKDLEIPRLGSSRGN